MCPWHVIYCLKKMACGRVSIILCRIRVLYPYMCFFAFLTCLYADKLGKGDSFLFQMLDNSPM